MKVQLIEGPRDGQMLSVRTLVILIPNDAESMEICDGTSVKKLPRQDPHRWNPHGVYRASHNPRDVTPEGLRRLYWQGWYPLAS